MRTKKVPRVEGLTTLSSRTVTVPGVTAAAVLVTMALLAVVAPIERPVIAPEFAPKVAAEASRPVGAVQVPLAIVQYSNFIEPTFVLLGTEKINS